MRIKIGIWDGGAADEAEGTVEWAGGYTDLSEAPFVMYVKNITIQDYTTSGTTYIYGDETGDYTSIIISGSSDNSTTSNSTVTTGTSYSSNSTVGTSSSGNATTTIPSGNAITTSSSTNATTTVLAASAASLSFCCL